MNGASITLRRARADEASVVVRHRRGMFHEMGNTDSAALDAMDASSLPFFAEALSDGSYVAWFAETPAGEVVAGGGVLVTPWPSNPREFHLACDHPERVHRTGLPAPGSSAAFDGRNA